MPLCPETKIPDRGITTLRRKLDQIQDEDITVHRQRVEALNLTSRHSIKYVESPCHRLMECMTYTLRVPIGLVNVAATFDIQLDFINLALPKLLREIPEAENSDGQIVLYFGDGETKHIGLVHGNRIISKWGKNPVYEHGIAEVPASYGDEYGIFNRPSATYITKKFIEFVRQHYRYVDISETFEGFVR